MTGTNRTIARPFIRTLALGARSTVSLAANPRGPIWFTTENGELSSISTPRTVGARGCSDTGCTSKIENIALARDGGIWFTASKKPILGAAASPP
jgi:hypothetical protein